MRRSDREIGDREEILKVMEKCDVCRLALNDDGYPYILPLNFGMGEEKGELVIYFHGAIEGTKYTLIEKDNRASFEMDCSHKLVAERKNGACDCTMEYESVIGRGIITMVPDEERMEALNFLMAHYHRETCPVNEETARRTRVFKLTVKSLTGKRRMR